MRAKPRLLTVVRSERLTPHMQRLVLGGDDLASFPEDSLTGYIKLMFSSDGQPLTQSVAGERPVARTYTVRAFDVARRELTVDFVLHGSDDGSNDGPASRWAGSASVGDRILVGGPGPTKLINANQDWCFLIGDMTALPAVSGNLEQLPADARGYAVIEVTSEEDRQTLEKPAGIELIWVTEAHHRTDSGALVECVRALPWLEGSVSVWAACEFHKMRQLRQYFRQERQTERSATYISSYWKLGNSEDQHKLAKKQDAETR